MTKSEFEREEAVAAVAFLHRLVQGGTIVSSNDCSATEIAVARAEGRLHVNAEGFGFVYRETLAEAAKRMGGKHAV